MYLILFILIFYICKFAYLLKKSIYNPEINIPAHKCTQWLPGPTGQCSAFLPQLRDCQQASFHSLLSGNICAFLCFLLMISHFKIASRHNANVLSSVPKPMNAVMCLAEKIHVLDKLHLGLSYSAVGSELSVNESTVLSKVSIHKIRLCIDLVAQGF